jgi:hypothetical protein
MDIKEMLLNTNVQNELTLKFENDLVLVLELLKKQNNEENIEEKVVNFALRKLFLELGLIEGELGNNNLILNRSHIRLYINENIILDYKNHINADVLFNHYSNWCIENKFIPLTKYFFYKEIVELGAIKRRTSKGYKFNGVTVIK